MDQEHINLDRRAGGHDAVIAISKLTHDLIIRLDVKLSDHMTNETEEMARMMADILARSFPNADPEGHKRDHELRIRRVEASTKFWETMSLEISKYGLIGFLVWAGYALWNAFLQGPHK